MHVVNTLNPKLILALDLDDPDEAEKLVRQLKGDNPYFKVGPQLLLAGGPRLIDRLRSEGAKIFLDLKFHDIPSTVLRSSRLACGLRPYMFDVHALAGEHAMKAAASAAREIPEAERPIVLAITLLVSHDESYLKRRFGANADVTSMVLELADDALSCGLDGIVCSASEAKEVRARFGTQLKIVCPGIRFPDGARDDYPSNRTARLGHPMLDLCDYLVVGRPIVQSENPHVALTEALRLLRSSSGGE